MKTKILLLQLFLFGALSAQDYTILEIPTVQNTYDSAYYFICDKTGEDSTKRMSLRVMSAKVKDETLSSGPHDRDATVIRISDNASTTEYKTPIRTIYPELIDYTIDPFVQSTDYFWKSTSGGTEKRTQASSIADYVTGSSYFTTDANAAIEALVDSAFIAAEIFNTVTRNIELIYSGSTYGYMSIHRIGYMVCGNVIATQTTTPDTYLVTESLPSWAIPDDMDRPTAIGFTFNNLEGGDDNYLFIQENGDIKILFADIDANTNGISFSWITE